MKQGDTITYSEDINYITFNDKEITIKKGTKLIIDKVFSGVVIAKRWNKTLILERKKVIM